MKTLIEHKVYTIWLRIIEICWEKIELKKTGHRFSFAIKSKTQNTLWLEIVVVCLRICFIYRNNQLGIMEIRRGLGTLVLGLYVLRVLLEEQVYIG